MLWINPPDLVLLRDQFLLDIYSWWWNICRLYLQWLASDSWEVRILNYTCVTQILLAILCLIGAILLCKIILVDDRGFYLHSLLACRMMVRIIVGVLFIFDQIWCDLLWRTLSISISNTDRSSDSHIWWIHPRAFGGWVCLVNWQMFVLLC